MPATLPTVSPSWIDVCPSVVTRSGVRAHYIDGLLEKIAGRSIFRFAQQRILPNCHLIDCLIPTLPCTFREVSPPDIPGSPACPCLCSFVAALLWAEYKSCLPVSDRSMVNRGNHAPKNISATITQTQFIAQPPQDGPAGTSGGNSRKLKGVPVRSLKVQQQWGRWRNVATELVISLDRFLRSLQRIGTQFTSPPFNSFEDEHTRSAIVLPRCCLSSTEPAICGAIDAESALGHHPPDCGS